MNFMMKAHEGAWRRTEGPTKYNRYNVEERMPLAGTVDASARVHLEQLVMVNTMHSSNTNRTFYLESMASFRLPHRSCIPP